MKKISQWVVVQKGHGKAAGEPVRSSARGIAAAGQPLSSAVSAGVSSFAIHSLTLA